MKRNYTIKLIHTTHTDIGYTHRQEKIMDFHTEFLKQAIEISEKLEENDNFIWVCENFWEVENFIKSTDEIWKERLIKAIKRGNIELTANYLNMSELTDIPSLKNKIKKAKNFAKKCDQDIETAMTADINGYGWSYSQAFYDEGIKYLFSCIHTHHGMYPLRKIQTPFYWKTPLGNKILVWNGDHYMTTASVGINAPEIMWIKEKKWELYSKIDQQIENDYEKLEQYINNLEKQNYEYSYIPLMTSGLETDNAPPNPYFIEYIKKWNEKYGKSIKLEMSTLKGFFKNLKKESKDIPTYSGDWPDWWTDGFGSLPDYTKMYRNAQADYELLKEIDKENIINEKTREEIEENLLLYSEHTCGYSASIDNPSDEMVLFSEARKNKYALDAHIQVQKSLDKILIQKGQQLLKTAQPLIYKVINTSNQEIYEIAKLEINYWELKFLEKGYKIIEEKTNEEYDYQSENFPRGIILHVPLKLKPLEEKILNIKLDKRQNSDYYKPIKLADGIYDIDLNKQEYNTFQITPEYIETKYIKIIWGKHGIKNMIDKQTNTDLVDKTKNYEILEPIYEITPNEKKLIPSTHRRTFGRNRRYINTQINRGMIKSIDILKDGNIFTEISIKYDLKGFSYYEINMIVYKNLKKIDIILKMNKQSIWEPESVLMALPINTGENSELWINKGMVNLRPAIDQLPGTCMEYYYVKDGILKIGSKNSVLILTPDVPLIQLSKPKYKNIKLYEKPSIEKNQDIFFSWIMNNIWETNFKASLGGFHSFKYTIIWDDKLKNPDKIFKKFKNNRNMITIRINNN
jgi:hypothetical protein